MEIRMLSEEKKAFLESMLMGTDETGIFMRTYRELITKKEALKRGMEEDKDG